ncbi:hypothetical protein [uncultured Akkermansia sp.]|uniref:hypothetical protein n=1 Tax=uncultured Akkermansia sp. TaxID=512294 RepID=UPI0025E9233E|nr:hypothetical protein [uncultured Akkermansia sp.]
MDRIYIHDACVLLDLIEGDLLDLWFQLGFETRTTHLVYQEILEEEQFSLLQTYVDADKLILESIDESDLPALNAQAKEWKVSLQDVSVAHLAKKHGGILLSGDKRLRTKSAEAGIEVKGILWVLDIIVERKLLIPQRALNALEAILEAGGRIPSEECSERRQRWGK